MGSPLARTSGSPSEVPRAERRPYIQARAETCLEKVFKFIAPLAQQLGVVYWLLEVLHELAATQMP